MDRYTVMTGANVSTEELKRVWGLIKAAHLVLKKDAVVEIYHHSGYEQFAGTGAVFINIINREYCKSYVVLLPGQSYPNHYHKIKIETFFVIHGDLKVICEDEESLLGPGDLMSIERGQSHSFSSDTGAVFEELSTTYVKNDSIYEDWQIRHSSYDQRKTIMPLCRFREMINDD